MTVFIDPPSWPAHGTVFSHLVSDHDYAELHGLAARVGVSPRAFDGDHYDVPASLHDTLVDAGAVPTSGADLVRRLNASGLRLRKRKGERGLARLFDQWTPFGTATLDVVGSRRPVDAPSVLAVLQRSDGPWGVPWHLVAATGDGPPARPSGDPVGWVRVDAGATRHMVQVLAGVAARPTTSPWTLFAP